MFAIIKTGGKQYKVSPGTKIWVEKLEAQVGETISVPEVLLLTQDDQTQVGTPVLNDALVEFTVLDQARADKVIVFKKKRRQGYRRKKGHRQHQTVLMTEKISFNGKVLGDLENSKVQTVKTQEKSSGIAQDSIPTTSVVETTLVPDAETPPKRAKTKTQGKDSLKSSESSQKVLEKDNGVQQSAPEQEEK